MKMVDLILFLVFNATFSNISAISWRLVLVVEEAGVPGENHRPWANNWEILLKVALNTKNKIKSTIFILKCLLDFFALH
jgi:hypothetical protein